MVEFLLNMFCPARWIWLSVENPITGDPKVKYRKQIQYSNIVSAVFMIYIYVYINKLLYIYIEYVLYMLYELYIIVIWCFTKTIERKGISCSPPVLRDTKGHMQRWLNWNWSDPAEWTRMPYLGSRWRCRWMPLASWLVEASCWTAGFFWGTKEEFTRRQKMPKAIMPK